MAKKKRTVKVNQGTIWLLVIIIISIIGALPQVAVGMNVYYIYLILGLGGAVIAILNIKKNEEVNFLIAITALIVVVMLALPSILNEVQSTSTLMLIRFLVNLVTAFGVAGFIVSLGKIIKISID